MGWTIRPTSFLKVINEEFDTMRVSYVKAILYQIVLRSPIDTGRFKANNIVSLGEPNDGYDVNKKDLDGSKTLQEGLAMLTRLDQRYQTVYIQNNLPYSSALEYGHSQQAPLGIYGLAAQSADARFK